MDLVRDAKFPDVLVSKLEYGNVKLLNNDLLGKTKVNFSALQDYYTYQLNFGNHDLLKSFLDSLSKAKTPKRLVVRYVYYNHGRNLGMESKIHIDSILSVYSKESL